MATGALTPELEKYIEQNYVFAKLPAPVQQGLGGSKREYDKLVVQYSLSHQLRYKKALVRKLVPDELQYYQQLLHHSREHMMLYPYHLADVLIYRLNETPFSYYHAILSHMLSSDRSYDALPNFSATDCLALVGIGRNEYIDLLNDSKSGRGMFRKRINPKNLLPKQPLPPRNLRHWWLIRVGRITENDIKLATVEEKALIDRLIDSGPQPAGKFNLQLLNSMFVKQFIHLDVPVQDDDLIKIPPLEGFVMNRVLGDYLEQLLYKIFVSVDEHTTLGDLATILRVSPHRVRDAVSMYCRLGFAVKKNVDTADALDQCHPSWMAKAEALRASTRTSVATFDIRPSDGRRRIGVVFDANLAAILMMGNLSPGLKKHAVTMFEASGKRCRWSPADDAHKCAGKITEETMDEFLSELDQTVVSGEGQTQEYTRQALILRDALRFLRHNQAVDIPGLTDNEQDAKAESMDGAGVDLLKCESVLSLDRATQQRVLERAYSLLITLAPLGQETASISSVKPFHHGPAIPECGTIWFRLWLASLVSRAPPAYLLACGTVLWGLPGKLLEYDECLVVTCGHEPTVQPTADLLMTLNDALAHSPVFVQGYRRHADADLSIEHVPLTVPPADAMDRVATLVANSRPAQPSFPALSATDENASLIDLDDALPALGSAPAPAPTDSDSPLIDLGAAPGESSTDAAPSATAALATTDSTPSAPSLTATHAEAVTRWTALHAQLGLGDLCAQLQVGPRTAGYISVVRERSPAPAEPSGKPATATDPSADASLASIEPPSPAEPDAPQTSSQPVLGTKPEDDDDDAVRKESIASSEAPWRVHEVQFGMPIFDATLSRAVQCSFLRTTDSAGESTELYHQRALSVRLLQFIATHGASMDDLAHNLNARSSGYRVPYPLVSLQCVDNKVMPFESH
ncbi:uncharacterized protein MONBRDRAFT_26464 [Monosiga brevicollis MX1]|uniref:FAM91 N-terminal domain-containing protein n=1 Tax=Monosiga brevicollis TaxID=81824 RepID=A9V2F8_MONBE|nr:uncharacterized protein MONBRDRAFT_26464 [Monosiga brevicollis MX1]EDQ88251.1 predicted protein [Monosiga brevicollis MX1]|eukprot:XP_001746844.1 hypothetical protein [Monosiga brevicollis MX1]